MMPLLLESSDFAEVVGASEDVRADSPESVKLAFEQHSPTHVLCLVGRTHGGGFPTIDYLESPEALRENVRDNLFAPLVLALTCAARGVHLTYLGTGCIFDSPAETRAYDEASTPDFFGSNYSIVKGMTDQLMHLLPGTVLNLRIRMPIDSIDHPRNFVSKLLKYERICSVPNSMSVLPSLLPCAIALMLRGHTGTVNLTNPGVISHDEVLAMYRELVDPAFSWSNFSAEEQGKVLRAGRSNNRLSTDVLRSLCPDVQDVHSAVRACLTEWKRRTPPPPDG